MKVCFFVSPCELQTRWVALLSGEGLILTPPVRVYRDRVIHTHTAHL